MTTPSRRRLMRDFRKLQDDPPSGVTGAPTEDNILLWHAVIFGPQETPFEDGTFKMTLEFSEEYPNKPPTVKFVSKMFHPNVYADGSICLDILQNRWSPTYDVAAVLTSIQSLLDEPNPNSPANSVAAQLYQENRREYEKRVQQIVEQSWEAFNTEMNEEEIVKLDTELREEFDHVEQEMQRQQEAAAAALASQRAIRVAAAAAAVAAAAAASDVADVPAVVIDEDIDSAPEDGQEMPEETPGPSSTGTANDEQPIVTSIEG